MKNVFSIVLVVVLTACNTTRSVEKSLLTGNYYEAIYKSLNQIQRARDNNKTNDQKMLLVEAFNKYTDEQLARINFLNQDITQANYEEIYLIYKEIDQIQNDIRPVMPIVASGKSLDLNLIDISQDLISAKSDYSNFLYDIGVGLMAKNNKLSYREAYYTFLKLNNFSPAYKNTIDLIEESKFKGTDFALIKTSNQTQVSIPTRLERDILDINLNEINNEWIIYHTNALDQVEYSYHIDLMFEAISFSPDQLYEKEKDLERIIQVTENQIDRDGNIIRDENGNPVTLTRNIIVEGTLNTISQTKAVSILAQVEYYDAISQQQMNSYKLDSQFIFENIFADFKGDDRVLTDEEFALTQGVVVPFPSNEQMLYDAAEDVKFKFKSILNQYSLN